MKLRKMENREKKSRLKIVIIILAIILALSAGGLAARYIYLAFFAPGRATVTVPDNLIGEEDTNTGSASSEAADKPASPASSEEGSEDDLTESSAGVSSRPSGEEDKPEAVRLELHQGKPGDNEHFETSNLFPGDKETKYFCVKVGHDRNIELYFRSSVIGETKGLGEALHIKVTRMESGEVLCDAPFAEVDGKEFAQQLSANASKETIAYYQIDVTMDTSVENEYQAAMLKADFEWYVKDEGGLTPPQTGEGLEIMLWVSLAGASVLLLIVLPAWKRKKGEEGNE